MTAESYQWLAKNVYAAGEPWWAKYAKAEGHELHLYENEVPFEDAEQLLAGWEPQPVGLLDEDTVRDAINAGLTGDDLIRALDPARLDTHKLLKASDTRERMDVTSIEYNPHLYRNWLTGTVKECIGDDVIIKSAGMFQNRNQAFVNIERPDSAVGPDGIKFSPFISLSTSYNRTMASLINQNTQLAVCDNTLRIAQGQGLASKIRHTSLSHLRLGEHRGVAARLAAGETDFRAELERELAVKVSDIEFSRFIDKFVPIDEVNDHPKKKARSERVRQELTQLYNSPDERIQGWRGTEFGVVQTVNTWQQHMSQLKNGTKYEMDDTNLRAMRNYAQMLRPMKDKHGDSPDERTVKVLESVLTS
jgi:phage/plasmid-like protein (TIGR03299 family)